LSGEISIPLFITIFRVIIAFIMAIIVGLPIGLVLGLSKKTFKSLEWIIDFFRSLPASAIFPAFMLFLGLGDKPIIGVSVFSCGLIIIVYTVYGVQNAHPHRREAARLMGHSKSDIFVRVIIPEILPEIFGGLRIGISVVLIIVIVCEMISGIEKGLGQYILNSYYIYATQKMWAGIVLTGILGTALNAVLARLEFQIAIWKSYK